MNVHAFICITIVSGSVANWTFVERVVSQSQPCTEIDTATLLYRNGPFGMEEIVSYFDLVENWFTSRATG